MAHKEFTIKLGFEAHKVATSGYGIVGIATAEYFAINQGVDPTFQCNHESEYYLAAMESLTSEQMESWRKRSTIYKGIVNCPVDIEVRDSNNQIVGKIKDNTVDSSISNGIVMDVNGDSKTFYIPSDMECDIILTGNNNGKMDYSFVEIDADRGEVGRKVYQDVSVTKGVSMKQHIDPEDNSKDLKNSNGQIINPNVVKTDTSNPLKVEVTVEGIGCADSLYNLMPGDYVTLSATTDDNNEFLGWYDKNGNLITKDNNYSYSIKQSDKFTAKFTENLVLAEGLNISSKSIKLAKGETAIINAKVLPENATVPYVEYESVNSNIVSCDSYGIIKGLKDGETEIKVTSYDGEVTEKIKVTVGNGNSGGNGGSNGNGNSGGNGSDSSRYYHELLDDDTAEVPSVEADRTITNIPFDASILKKALPVGTVVSDSSRKFKYQVTKSATDGSGRVALFGAVSKNIKTAVIPDTVVLEGVSYQVTSIKAYAFCNRKKLKSVSIGANVTKIGKYAFYGCKKLKSIEIRTEKLTAKNIGDKAFSKTAKKPTVTVPASKKKSYKKWLRKKGLSKKAKFK